jgi:hypothetical protein
LETSNRRKDRNHTRVAGMSWLKECWFNVYASGNRGMLHASREGDEITFREGGEITLGEYNTPIVYRVRVAPKPTIMAASSPSPHPPPARQSPLPSGEGDPLVTGDWAGGGAGIPNVQTASSHPPSRCAQNTEEPQ